MDTIKLISIDGKLYFPFGGMNFDTLENDKSIPSLLMRRYPAGDIDTIPWPMVSKYKPRDQLIERLQDALFDERETNSFFPVDALIQLPDGELFDF